MSNMMAGVLERRKSPSMATALLLVCLSARGVQAHGHDHDMEEIPEGQHMSAEPIVGDLFLPSV